MKSRTNFTDSIKKASPLRLNESISNTLIPRTFALILALIISPIVLINITIAFSKGNALFCNERKQDALGRPVLLHIFNSLFFPKSGLLFDIINGHLSFTGIPLTHSLTRTEQYEILSQYSSKPGIFSLYELHKTSGLAIANKKQLLIRQLNSSFMQKTCLVMKSIMCLFIYSSGTKKLNNADNINLFGFNITNSTILEAADWATLTPRKNLPNIGFYVNAHSINLSISTPIFNQNLKKADVLFADGSGMRMAAKKAGYQLKDNNNGTDMLPHLCLNCVRHRRSIFLLGSKPGVATQAAKNLTASYPELFIAGVQHGYTPASETDALIAQINSSNCDILLVAMGSPIQESWILEHRSNLQCKTILAVGGLLDFYSGEISRAPMWLRELGLEWIWRLIKEPKSKFYRYVIGNPLFLFRIHALNLVHQGEKK